jgi:hypothetical protein
MRRSGRRETVLLDGVALTKEAAMEQRGYVVRSRRTRSLLARGALVLLAAAALYQGVWAQLAPRSFYDGFPGGLGWVALSGPYNEHLVRDVGGLINGLGLVAALAALSLARPLLIANAVGWLVYGLPHFAFHVDHPLTDVPMQALNVGILVAEVLLPGVGLLALTPPVRRVTGAGAVEGGAARRAAVTEADSR